MQDVSVARQRDKHEILHSRKYPTEQVGKIMLPANAPLWEISDMLELPDLRGAALYEAMMLLKPSSLSETVWAAKAGVNRGFFTNLKNSNIAPRSDTLRKLLREIGHTESDLYATADVAPTVRTVQAVESVPGTSNDGVVTLRSFDLSYSMGPGTNIDDYVEEEEVQFDAGMLSKLTRAPAESLFVARGDGDSMFPTLLNEDTVVIDTTQKVVNLRDRIWACSIYGAGAIKRLRPSAEGKVEVISDNPAIKDDLVDAADIHIIGRVIWLGRRV